MAEPTRIVIERVDWKNVLPVIRLVSAFKHALQPSKLLVALVAVIAIHLSGISIDALMAMGKSSDAPGDLHAYEKFVHLEANAIGSLMTDAVSLEHGIGPTSDGVVDDLYAVFVGIPALMFENHFWFSLLFGIDVLFALAMVSGIITRMSASQVCKGTFTPFGKASRYVVKRWSWYVLTPLMPAALIVVVGALLALVGLVLYNIPGLHVVGSIGYGLFLLLGFVIAVVAMLLLLALFLMPPALSVEGSDGFDAIARSFNYILFRPWQFAAYLLASVLYLAVVYVLVGTVASVTVDATAQFVEMGAMKAVEETGSAPQSKLDLILNGDPGDAGGAIGVSAWIVARWLELVTAIVIAILLSTICTLQTQVYVLMRRSADGTPMDQHDDADPGSLWPDEPATPAEPEASTQTEG